MFNVFKHCSHSLIFKLSHLGAVGDFIWLLYSSEMIPVFLWSFFAFRIWERYQVDYIFVPERFCPSGFSKKSFFNGNWYLETTICMFGAFIVTGFSLFLRCFQWTELINTFFRKRNKRLVIFPLQGRFFT